METKTKNFSYKNNYFFVVVIGLFLFVLLFMVVFISATNCWQYTSVANGCNSANGCFFRNDTWGSWCEEFQCGSLYNQTSCSSTSVPGKNCTWTGGTTWNYCEELSCWSFSGTNQSACTNNIANKSCSWNQNCYSVGGTSCWGITAQSDCQNTVGCAWGTCDQKNCYSYSDSNSCVGNKDWNGNNCTWSSSGNYCTEDNCWNSQLYGNQTACNAATNVKCEWKYGSCQEKNCWNFDFTNQSACVNNTIGLKCAWNQGSYCVQDNCWTSTTQQTCTSKSNCRWSSSTSSGWCEEVNCWKWDSWQTGGSEGACNGNSSIYSLNCIWQNDSTGTGSGWCYKDNSATNCANLTTERNCYDTNYCWWQANDWSDSTTGGNCSDPTWGVGSYVNVSSSILNDWNPGCYIFDINSTKCNLVIGCNYTNSKCVEILTGNFNATGSNISTNGILCNYINDSQLCNNIATLSSCCSWQNGTCSADRYSNTCVTGLAQTPNGETSCEDAKKQSDCNTIANDPWYMPCDWDNSTNKCEFKTDEVFGNSSFSIVKLENKRSCESAGGKWITENYCEGSVSVPIGRCEYKFDEEFNCDKACFACESRDSNGNVVNSSNAESSCLQSRLGFCEYTASTSAPNGVGYCNAKDQWKLGFAGDCNKQCGDCNYLGDPKSNVSEDSSGNCLSPSCYCTDSNANSANGGCKWIVDNSTTTGGYCLEKGDKTCLDACDRCKTRNKCVNDGRGAQNSSGSCKWEGTDTDGSCVSNIAGDSEVCWDGIDNNDNGLIDCADSSCYSDSWCGFVSGDCFGWTNNATCISNSCEWVNDTWNPTGWCDFKGSSCWKLNNNESVCNGNANCLWSNGTGTGWCERDWSIAEVCFSANKSDCGGVANCVWTNDTWCDGLGQGTDWCNNNGGWCDHTDFAPKNCWNKFDNSSCSTSTGCAWKLDTWSTAQCEVNWTGNCWNYISNSTCSANGCLWRNETWGSYNSAWCDNIFGNCWTQYNQDSCNSVTGVNCTWKNYSGWGSCEPTCYSVSSNSECTSITGCTWRGETGWCEEQQSQACYNITNFDNSTSCSATSGCKWKNPGWCDPKDGGFSGGSIAVGGGVGGSVGADCYKYDGNKTLCTNKTLINITCGWIPEVNPYCQVDWSTDCWKFTNSSTCNEANGGGKCWWYNDTSNGGIVSCMNIMDQCWTNSTLQGDASACNSNQYCNATIWGGCEPTCFSATTSASCGAGCKWTNGWCNSAGLNNIFDEMEAGAPVPLGTDGCGTESINQASIDICGFGMKDMGDGFGFGVNVRDFSNSSVCNKEKIKSYVFEGFSGFGNQGISDRIGDGNETTKFYVYLDTDGVTTGGCSLSHNSSAVGYEFRFNYASEWNASKSKAVESFNPYKCENSKWVATDIKLKVWKKIMCGEIGGAMVAIEKSDLTRFPNLYDATKDMRVYTATSGETGNISSPVDTAGPAWTTPGSVDFEISDAFAYGSDSAKFENILQNGFIIGEDCFDNVDNDNDGAIDCNDEQCQYSSQCTNLGVNAPGHNDTSTPRVVGVKIEEYTDSALIMYDTNKPANGTLLFYGNDTTCTSLNDTIYDVGSRSANVREYKLWHTGEIFNDSSSLDYNLYNNTKYYYKLRVCDSGSKCAISRCSSFVTEKTGKCGFCDFVTRIKMPTGWNVTYDSDQDGTYDHLQGQVCGATAGMKTNYTGGRRVNIKLQKNDNSVYIEFINASLTKTGLNDKVRTISGSGAIISDSAIVGLTSTTRDKIINNLHPEICRIKIPFSGTCDSIFHCDDAGNNCVDRTSTSTLLDAANCIWQIPFCEFSTYREAQASGSSSGGGSSGGGGGSSGGGSSSSSSKTTITPEKKSPDAEVPITRGETPKGDEKESDVPAPETGKKSGKLNLVFIVMGLVGVALVIVGATIFIKRKRRHKLFGF